MPDGVRVLNALTWLLGELPAYVLEDRLPELLARYEAQKRAYARQSRIAQLERIIKLYKRRNDPNDAAYLAQRRAKLAALKEELL